MEPSNSSNSNNMNDDDSEKRNCANKPKNIKKHGNTAKNSSSAKKGAKVSRLKSDSIVEPSTKELSDSLVDSKSEKIPVRTDISSQRKPTSFANSFVIQDSSSHLSELMSSCSDSDKSRSKGRLKLSAGSCNPSPNPTNSFHPSSTTQEAAAVIPIKIRTHKLPILWWFGFSRSYEDGRAGEEGRICHVLSEFGSDDRSKYLLLIGFMIV